MSEIIRIRIVGEGGFIILTLGNSSHFYISKQTNIYF